MTKNCSKPTCNQPNPQPLSNFYKNRVKPGGLSAYCKKCSNEYSLRNYYKNHEKYKAERREWHFKNRDHALELGRKNWLKRNYNLKVEDYELMLKSQKGRCDICKRKSEEFRYRLAVDHCHDSKRVRGLLCANCNQMIGAAKEKTENLKSGIAYLEKHNEAV